LDEVKKMEEFEGLLVKTVLLQEQPMRLSLIKLAKDGEITEGIIKDRYLSNYIFRLPNNKYTLKVTGKRNQRNQLVIKHMQIKNVDDYIKVIGTPE
jgi:hypothetical protein